MRHIHFLWVICTPLVIVSVQQQTVRIGAIFPFDNDDGNQLLAGSLMAISDLNALYKAERNISFKVAVRDSEGTFSDSILASLDIAVHAFGGQGVHIFLGAGSNTQSEALAFATRDHDIAMVGYASNASSLSHDVDFPQVSRVYPSSSNEGTAMAHMISSYFGYSRVLLIHSSDQYGIDGANLFTETAVMMGIDIVSSVEIRYYDYELLPVINGILAYDCRVFVFILSDVRQAGLLLYEGSTVNFFNQNTVVFCSGSLLTSQIWSFIGAKNQELSRMMGGVFTVSVADNDWKVTTKGQEFIRKFRSLPNTITKYPNGTTECPADKDDDGNFFLYRSDFDRIERKYNCTGIIFSDFAENGEDISPYAAYSYDATWAAGVSTLLYTATFHNNTVPSRISGKDLQSIMTVKPKISFTGYTGNVEFSSASSDIDHYGSGDRILGVRYNIGNFHPGNGSETDFAFKRVGTWTQESGFELCGTDPTLQSTVTGGCFSLKYGTIDNLRPLDRAPTVYRKMSENLKILLYFCATIDFSIIIFFAVVMILYRKTRLLRALQPSMMWIILTANIFNAIRIVLAAMPATRVVCGCSVWMGHLGTSVRAVVSINITLL
jgi:ABC-type branched-subunit amino acid transport system substrate-binding protein